MLAIIAAEIGAIAVARTTAKSQPDLSNHLIAFRRVLGEIGGAGADVKAEGSAFRPATRGDLGVPLPLVSLHAAQAPSPSHPFFHQPSPGFCPTAQR